MFLLNDENKTGVLSVCENYSKDLDIRFKNWMSGFLQCCSEEETVLSRRFNQYFLKPLPTRCAFSLLLIKAFTNKHPPFFESVNNCTCFFPYSTMGVTG